MISDAVYIDTQFRIFLDRMTDEQKANLLELLLADELPDQQEPIIWMAYEVGIELGLIKLINKPSSMDGEG